MSSVTTTATLTSASGGGTEGTCVVASVGHAYFHRRRRRRRDAYRHLPSTRTQLARSLARHAVPSEQHTFVHVCVNILQWTSGRGRGVKLLTRGGVEEGATQTTDCTAHQYLLFVDAEAVINHCSHRDSFSPSFHFFHSLFFFARA